jgi:hypothetical protein
MARKCRTVVGPEKTSAAQDGNPRDTRDPPASGPPLSIPSCFGSLALDLRPELGIFGTSLKIQTLLLEVNQILLYSPTFSLVSIVPMKRSYA